MLCPSCGRDNQPGATFCDSCANRLDDSAGDAVPNDLVTSHDFVGRRQEMGELITALDHALGGRGRLVMLVGEPGIGKTRIAQELAVIAEQRGARVLWGRCYEGEGAPPYWPWVQPIRTYIQDEEPENIESVMDAGAADIAEIVPQLRQKLPDLQPPPSLEPSAARFRLFDSITTFLKNASSTSGGRPLVLILDNLHWADRTSLLLLEFLAPELERSHILVLGTYRDVDVSRSHPLSQTLGNLIREHLFQRVQLLGMTLEEVRRFIEINADTSVSSDLVDAVHARTEGNPLFVTEVVRLLKLEGFEEGQSWDVRIPEGIRDAIGRRLSRLSEKCNQVLTTASVIGREFNIQQLDRLVDGLSEDEMLGVLEEAARGYVIEEVEGGIGMYRFTHALIQQTLAGELSTTRKVRLHSHVIEMFEKLYSGDIEVHAVELAYHAAEAEAMIGPEKLLRYSILAGEQFLESYAWEDAFAHFQRALDAREDQAMDDQLAVIKFGIGRAMAQMVGIPNGAQKAWDILSQTFEYYVGKGDIEEAVNVAIHPIPILYLIKGAAELFARAIELVPRDSLQAGYLFSKRASALIFESTDIKGSLNAAMEAMTIARREGDEVLEALSLGRLIRPLVNDHRPLEAIDAGLQAIEIAHRTDDIQSEQRAQFAIAQALLIVGEPDRARFHADATLQAADMLHQRDGHVRGLLISADCAAYQGHWSKANELADKALKILPQNGGVLGLKAWMSLQSSDAESMQLLVEEHSSDPNAVIYMISWLTRAAYETDNNEYLDSAALVAGEPSTHSLRSLWIDRCAAVVAVLRKDTAAAAEHYSALALDKGTFGPALFGVDHILGLLAQTMSHLDDAQVHFEEALAYCRKAGYRPELAWTCYDYATLRHAQGERSDALALLDEALEISNELGMRPLIMKATALGELVESQPASAPRYPDGLTEREVEVLRLVAAGRSNREIGEELFIALNTVARHVSNIFSKTDSSNRAEAATYANQHNLLQ